MPRRFYRQSNSSKITQYNRQTVAALKAINPEAAATLYDRGSSLGWWNTVDYFRTSGQSVGAAALAVSKQFAKETAI